jgi:hypothetical protein
VTRELYVDGRLFLVQDGDSLLEPINGALMETGRRPDAERCFGIQTNYARDQGENVQVRER